MRGNNNPSIKFLDLSISWNFYGIVRIDTFTCFIILGATHAKCFHPPRE
jgi:hypothetical protein